MTSTNPSKLRKIYSQQKHATRIICNEDRYTHARPEKSEHLNRVTNKHISNTKLCI